MGASCFFERMYALYAAQCHCNPYPQQDAEDDLHDTPKRMAFALPSPVAHTRTTSCFIHIGYSSKLGNISVCSRSSAPKLRTRRTWGWLALMMRARTSATPS